MNQRDWEWEDLLARKQKERDAALKKQAEEEALQNKEAEAAKVKRPFDESSLDEELDEEASAPAEPKKSEKKEGKKPEKKAAEKTEKSAAGKSEKKSTGKTGTDSGKGKNSDRQESNRVVRSKKPVFLIGYLIFVVILMLIAFFFLRGVNKTMIEMRDNEPESIVRSRLSEIPDEDIAALFVSNPAYENPSDAVNNIRAYLAQEELTIRKAEKNLYDIYRGNTLVFHARLNTLESVSHLGLLNYDILEFAGFEPVEGGELYRYEIIAPSTSEITINGFPVGAPDSSETVGGFGDAGDFVTLPTINTYTVAGLTAEPDIRVRDNGTEIPVTLAPVIDLSTASGAGTVYQTFEDTGIDFDAMGFARQWNLFMTDDLGGDLHGYWQLAPYFIEGTSMQRKAYDWATGIDITLTSFHTAPEISGERIYDIVCYGEDAARYTVYMEKTMTLTRTDEEKLDIFESTVYLVRVDGEWKVANVRGGAEE